MGREGAASEVRVSPLFRGGVGTQVPVENDHIEAQGKAGNTERKKVASVLQRDISHGNYHHNGHHHGSEDSGPPSEGPDNVKGPDSDGQHKSPHSDGQDKGPESDGQHKGPNSDGQDQGPHSEGQESGQAGYRTPSEWVRDPKPLDIDRPAKHDDEEGDPEAEADDAEEGRLEEEREDQPEEGEEADDVSDGDGEDDGDEDDEDVGDEEAHGDAETDDGEEVKTTTHKHDAESHKKGLMHTCAFVALMIVMALILAGCVLLLVVGLFCRARPKDQEHVPVPPANAKKAHYGKRLRKDATGLAGTVHALEKRATDLNQEKNPDALARDALSKQGIQEGVQPGAPPPLGAEAPAAVSEAEVLTATQVTSFQKVSATRGEGAPGTAQTDVVEDVTESSLFIPAKKKSKKAGKTSGVLEQIDAEMNMQSISHLPEEKISLDALEHKVSLSSGSGGAAKAADGTRVGPKSSGGGVSVDLFGTVHREPSGGKRGASDPPLEEPPPKKSSFKYEGDVEDGDDGGMLLLPSDVAATMIHLDLEAERQKSGMGSNKTIGLKSDEMKSTGSAGAPALGSRAEPGSGAEKRTLSAAGEFVGAEESKKTAKIKSSSKETRSKMMGASATASAARPQRPSLDELPQGIVSGAKQEVSSFPAKKAAMTRALSREMLEEEVTELSAAGALDTSGKKEKLRQEQTRTFAHWQAEQGGLASRNPSVGAIYLQSQSIEGRKEELEAARRDSMRVPKEDRGSVEALPASIVSSRKQALAAEAAQPASKDVRGSLEELPASIVSSRKQALAAEAAQPPSKDVRGSLEELPAAIVSSRKQALEAEAAQPPSKDVRGSLEELPAAIVSSRKEAFKAGSEAADQSEKNFVGVDVVFKDQSEN
eukprot:g6811.t1